MLQARMYCPMLLVLLSYVSPSDNLGPLLQDKVFNTPSKAGLGTSQHSGFPGQHGANDRINRWMLQETSTLPSLEEQKISFEYFLNQLEDSTDLYSNKVNKISANDETTFRLSQYEEKSKENNNYKVDHLTFPDFPSTRRKPTFENSENSNKNGKLPETVSSRSLNSLFEPSVVRNGRSSISSQSSLLLINSLKRIARETVEAPTREELNCQSTQNHERLGTLKSDDNLFISSLRHTFIPTSHLRSSMDANPNKNRTPLVIEEKEPIQNKDVLESSSSTKRIDLFKNYKVCSISDLKESPEFSPSPVDNMIQKDFLRRGKREATKVNFKPSTPDPVSFLPDWAEFAADSGSVKGGWPVRRVCELPGELLLGGLVMVHERSDTVTCGPVMPQGGIQALETMLYTLDVINSRHQLPFTLGAHILDDCDKDTYGLEMAVDFIKGSISNIDDAEYHCNKTQVRKVISGVVGAASSVTSIQVANLLRLFKIPQVRKVISGVVGAASSVTSIQVANLLRLFNIPQVSYWSTSPELSNKQRFEYFSRTIPSDHHQAQAMVELVKRLGWSYVSIIYEESNYGIKARDNRLFHYRFAFEELEQLLAKAGVCIAVKEKLAKDSGVAEDRAYDNVVLKLQTKPRARGAIVFASDQEVAGLMRAVRRCNATGSFSWIGSDGWSARSLVSEGSEPEVEGTLSVQPQANPVTGFDQYFLNLTVENNRRNPWFVEFWEDHFQCRYPGSPATPYNQRYSRNCGPQDRLTRDNTAFENQLQFVSDAVMSLAVALGDMHAALCKTGPLCAAMTPTSGSDLLRFLRRVNFKVNVELEEEEEETIEEEGKIEEEKEEKEIEEGIEEEIE
ncbi:hypothetical protein J6590_053310 [Homalodisca vitripennis]|nr:hypothetical protein J6590_053310 [Homalodisca vitripennis]